MEISKLKIDGYENIRTVNFPDEYDLAIKSESQDVQVVIYYIDSLSDVDDFVKHVKDNSLPKDNRTIMVYKKGRKDGINRDNIVLPFREGVHGNFKIRKPALCSLSKELSAFVQSYEG